jgi:hypothetical protein
MTWVNRSQPTTASLLALLLLSGCYEPASTWSEKQGRYRPTDEVRREQINAEIDKRAKASCRWMEIEQPGQWEVTCDPDQKRKF